MRAGRAASAILLAVASLIGALPVSGQQPAAPSAAEIAQEELRKGEELYAAGEYPDCQALVSRLIAESEAGSSSLPPRIMARIHRLDALLAYAFRDEGYAERIETQLRKGLALDLDLEIGDPAEVPPIVLDLFAKVKTAYLAQFSRTARRNAVGISGALVLEPTVFQNPSLLQPGIFYTYNLTESLTLDFELRMPLQLPIWNSIRGQAGLVWYPASQVERIVTGVSFAYQFGLDALSVFTHSLSFGGKMEFLARSGFGLAGNAELLRVDLVLGTSASPQPPKYTQIPFLGLLQVVFANITLYAFYAF